MASLNATATAPAAPDRDHEAGHHGRGRGQFFLKVLRHAVAVDGAPAVRTAVRQRSRHAGVDVLGGRRHPVAGFPVPGAGPSPGWLRGTRRLPLRERRRLTLVGPLQLREPSLECLQTPVQRAIPALERRVLRPQCGDRTAGIPRGGTELAGSYGWLVEKAVPAAAVERRASRYHAPAHLASPAIQVPSDERPCRQPRGHECRAPRRESDGADIVRAGPGRCPRAGGLPGARELRATGHAQRSCRQSGRVRDRAAGRGPGQGPPRCGSGERGVASATTPMFGVRPGGKYTTTAGEPEVMRTATGQAIGLPSRGMPLRLGETVTCRATVIDAGINCLNANVPLPMMILKDRALVANIATMAAVSKDAGFLLAPHGKTTMSPEIFRRQLAAGAWGLTVANVVQGEVARAAGAYNILIANEVSGAGSIAWLVEASSEPGLSVVVLVDSIAGAQLLADQLSAAHLRRPLPVLIELGVPGGRAGCRDRPAARRLAEAIGRMPSLALYGVEGYEGIVASDRSAKGLSAVDGYLAQLYELALELAHAGVYQTAGRDRPIVSAGGSQFFDRVVRHLVDVDWKGGEVDVVVRAGSYVTHDHGLCARTSPLATPDAKGRVLVPAIEILADIVSSPESGRAIAGFGKRDAPYDVGLPVPLWIAPRGGRLQSIEGRMTVDGLDDQHAYISTGAQELRPGDVIGVGVSHPCTAFDKWRWIPVVDDDYFIIDVLETAF